MSKPVPLYQLTLEDCATPSFCSASKPYFGTQKQILRLLARREDGVCLRALQAVFTDLGLVDDVGKPSAVLPLRLPFWGYPNMIFRRGRELKSRLLLFERRFDSREDALSDLAHPAEPCFDPFFWDIFGDG